MTYYSISNNRNVCCKFTTSISPNPSTYIHACIYVSIRTCVNIIHIYQIKYLWPCLVSNMKQIFKSSRYHQCHSFPLSFQQSISSYCGTHPDPFYVTVIQWFISRQCYPQLLRIVTAFIQLNRRVSNIIILF